MKLLRLALFNRNDFDLQVASSSSHSSVLFQLHMNYNFQSNHVPTSFILSFKLLLASDHTYVILDLKLNRDAGVESDPWMQALILSKL